MKYYKIVFILILIFTLVENSFSKIKNQKIYTGYVWGNCNMCKKNIEQAANLKNEAKADWNINTKILTLYYDSLKVSVDSVLKHIALAGYDNEKYTASANAYAALHECCHYSRKIETSIIPEVQAQSAIAKEPQTTTDKAIEDSIINILDIYFLLKNYLVSTDASKAQVCAANLMKKASHININNTSTSTTNLLNELIKNTNAIATTKNIDEQRKAFMAVSATAYLLLKEIKYAGKIYYIFCPMADNGKGAYWLSKDKIINNPYYGYKMLHCGKIVQVIE